METQFNGREMLFVVDAISLSGTGTRVSASTLLFRGSPFVRALSRAIKSATITLATREIFVVFRSERLNVAARPVRFIVSVVSSFIRTMVTTETAVGTQLKKSPAKDVTSFLVLPFAASFFFRDARVEKFREYSLERTGEGFGLGFMRLIRRGQAGRFRFTPQLTTFSPQLLPSCDLLCNTRYEGNWSN